jgi:hypothetical protein
MARDPQLCYACQRTPISEDKAGWVVVKHRHRHICPKCRRIGVANNLDIEPDLSRECLENHQHPHPWSVAIKCVRCRRRIRAMLHWPFNESLKALWITLEQIGHRRMEKGWWCPYCTGIVYAPPKEIGK